MSGLEIQYKIFQIALERELTEYERQMIKRAYLSGLADGMILNK